MAEYQAKKFSVLEGCTLSACKDHKADHAEEFARRFRIPARYSSLDALLDADVCDALTCAVIDSRHRVLSEPVLRRGLPLLSEKPLGRTVADCAALAALAADAGVPNLVNFSKRNAPALAATKVCLQDGIAGRILSVEAEYLQGWVATGAWGDWMTVPRWKWRLTPELSTAMQKGFVSAGELPDEFRFPGETGEKAAAPDSVDGTALFSILAAGNYDGTVDVEGWNDAEWSAEREIEGQRNAMEYLKRCRGGTPRRS
jgi:hypothetical protein